MQVLLEEISPLKLWQIRVAIGDMISKKGLKYKRSLVNYETPKWELNKLPDIGYVRIAPKVKSLSPDCDSFKPTVIKKFRR